MRLRATLDENTEVVTAHVIFTIQLSRLIRRRPLSEFLLDHVALFQGNRAYNSGKRVTLDDVTSSISYLLADHVDVCVLNIANR